MNCTHKGCNGLMVVETAADFYTAIMFYKCVNCGRIKEIAAKDYAFREEEKERVKV